MARLSIFCILLVVLFAYLENTDAASRVARSPQYGVPHGIPPPPPRRGYGPDCGPYGPPGRFDRGPGRFDRGPSHHGQGHHDREKYNIPPGGSISISKTISISSGGNAQSSAGSSAGSNGGSSAGSNAESSASGK